MATLSYVRPASDAAEVPRGHLFVVLACATPDAGGARHALDDVDEVRVGRGAARAAARTVDAGRRVLHVTLPDARVSTAHARLTRDGGTWRVEDLRSKNGTYVEGARVERADLDDGALVQMGETLLVLRTAMPTQPGAPNDLDVRAGGAFATLVPSLARSLDELLLAAASNVPILLTSETGTGKEVIARAVHAIARPRGPFVAINCGALPATLTESVLFGHRRGAFSGATTDNEGLLRAADGGTLLFDEIGEMPPALQPALLRALETGEILPVGATQPVRTTARFVAATHADLLRRVAAGAFREDLYARLAGFVFHLPPLRARREDFGLVAGALLRRIGDERREALTIAPEAATSLLRHDWPRNVRELEKCLARAAVLARGARIEPAHLPAEILAPRARDASPPEAGSGDRDDATRARLVTLLARERGNLAAVAAAMQTSRSQVHRWLKRFEIDPRGYRA